MVPKINDDNKPELHPLQYHAQPIASAGLYLVGESAGSEAPLDAGVTESPIGAAYQRVSTDGHEFGTSLANQTERNIASAASEGVHIPDEYNITDIGSGADPGRLGFQQLCSLVQARRVQHVFVWDADRLARDPLLLLTFVRMCEEARVLLHFVPTRNS